MKKFRVKSQLTMMRGSGRCLVGACGRSLTRTCTRASRASGSCDLCNDAGITKNEVVLPLVSVPRRPFCRSPIFVQLRAEAASFHRSAAASVSKAQNVAPVSSELTSVLTCRTQYLEPGYLALEHLNSWAIAACCFEAHEELRATWKESHVSLSIDS